jgi:hypothetical protein
MVAQQPEMSPTLNETGELARNIDDPLAKKLPQIAVLSMNYRVFTSN